MKKYMLLCYAVSFMQKERQEQMILQRGTHPGETILEAMGRNPAKAKEEGNKKNKRNKNFQEEMREIEESKSIVKVRLPVFRGVDLITWRDELRHAQPNDRP